MAWSALPNWWSQAGIAGDTVRVAAAMISTSPISEKPWPATSTRWTEGNFSGMGQLSDPLDSTGHYRILGLVKMEKTMERYGTQFAFEVFKVRNSHFVEIHHCLLLTLPVMRTFWLLQTKWSGLSGWCQRYGAQVTAGGLNGSSSVCGSRSCRATTQKWLVWV